MTAVNPWQKSYPESIRNYQVSAAVIPPYS